MIYNEERQIRQCLETIKWVDEIIICDSFSTDRTIEICREYTNKIFQRKFDNFGNQKKWTLDKPSHDWVLFVEADERFSDALRDEIRERLSRDEGYDGYWMPFRNYFLGRQMKGHFWEFKKIKLYKKGKGCWQDRRVHANFILDGKTGELNNPVSHYPYANLQVFLTKLRRATRFEAEELIRNNRKLGWLDTVKALCWIPRLFIKYYVIWGDYKNGAPGLIFSICGSPYVAMVNFNYWKIRLHGKK